MMAATKYKDSGIEWIGRIPESWDVDIAKRVFKQRRDKGNEECQLLAATQKYGMYPQHLLEGVVKVAADTDLSLFKTVHKNDYVISLRSFQGGFEMSDYEGVCSPAYQVFYATRQISNQYYKYLFKSDAFIQEINSLTVGIREGKNILYDDFALLPIPIPAASDQQRIADFLDKKCGEIDSLIALQEQMIEKLKAYKQSVITEAVTKGLNPNTKLVPSGIDWIGDIPEGWKICRLKHFLKKEKNNLRVGPFGSALSGNDFKTEGYWVYNQRCVLDNNFLSNDTFVDSNKYNELKSFEVRSGDILVTTRGSIGKIAIVPDNAPSGILHPCLIRFVIDNSMYDVSLLQHIFNGSDFVLKQIRYQSNSTTIDVLYSYALKNIIFPLPSLSEQHAIATYLDEKCADIDRLIALKQQKIESLKDYKKSVIYEAVSGKTEI